MKAPALKLFLVTGALEGLAALVWLLWGRSMERNAFFLGYSANRLALAAALLAPLGLLLAAAVSAARRPDRLARAAAWCDRHLRERDRLLLPLFGFVCAAGSGALFLALTARLPSPGLDAFLAQFSAGLPLLLERLTPAITRARPAVLWLGLLAAQTAVLLLASYPAEYREKWRSGAVASALLAVVIVLAAAAQLTILAFRLKTLMVIPGWKWYFHDKPLTPGGLALFGGLLALTLLLAAWLAREPAHPRRWVLVLVLLGAAWQIAFGFIEGGGFETLRLKYADSVFNNYAEAAAQQPGWLRPLRDYEELYAGDWYLGTKPPGVLLSYILLDKVSNLIAPAVGAQARFVRLTAFSAYVFPFLSMLVLFPLQRLARALTGERGTLLPGLLYLSIPAVILIPLFLDQALYPLLFVLVLLLALAAMQRRSYGLAFLTGLSSYAALYFSFSLLPLLPLAGLWLALDGWMRRKQIPLKQTALLLLVALGAGVLAGLVLFRVALNYDILLRYTRAMAQHQRAKDFRPGLSVLLEAVQLNNAEFLTWSGPALVLSFLAALPISLSAWWKQQTTRADALLLAFFLTYLALNLLGQTHGEVQRLWIFLLPLVCLYAAPQVRRLFTRPWPGLALVLGLQLVVTLFIYAFQDFYG